MDIEIASKGFAAIGSQPRLEVLQTLVRAGNSGLSIGEIQVKTGIPASTLAHHLKALVQAELIRQQKSGRTTLNRADFQHLEELGQYVLNECCLDESGNND